MLPSLVLVHMQVDLCTMASEQIKKNISSTQQCLRAWYNTSAIIIIIIIHPLTTDIPVNTMY